MTQVNEVTMKKKSLNILVLIAITFIANTQKMIDNKTYCSVQKIGDLPSMLTYNGTLFTHYIMGNEYMGLRKKLDGSKNRRKTTTLILTFLLLISCNKINARACKMGSKENGIDIPSDNLVGNSFTTCLKVTLSAV